MSGNYKWSKKRLLAAKLVAENDMSGVRIAEELGIAYKTLNEWKADPAFKTKVGEFLEEIEAEMLRLPISKRNIRLRRLNDLQERLQFILDDRQAAYAGDEAVVGGRSGLITKQVKSVGYGKETRVVEESSFDASVVREIRAIDEQAARELGQWIDKGELTGQNGTPLVLTEVVVDLSSLGAAPEDDDDDDIDE